MHGTTLAAEPPYLLVFWIFASYGMCPNAAKKGLACYFTMDAGPNVKVLCQNKKNKRFYVN